MKLEKYISEVQILKTYFEHFCQHNHTNQLDKEICYNYKDQILCENVKLCDKCLETIQYSIQRLQHCQYEEKPRCRSCKTPCYEKSYWKTLAKVMIYSSLRLGVTNFINKLTTISKL